MFENLTDKLERSFQILKGEGRITEINVAESLKEIRRALIDADVNNKVAKNSWCSITTIDSIYTPKNFHIMQINFQ